MKTDRVYLLKRESEERAAATQAQGKARAAHEELANLYRERAAHAEQHEDARQPTNAPAQAE